MTSNFNDQYYSLIKTVAVIYVMAFHLRGKAKNCSENKIWA